ncbi:MAG TPA: Xaa-Pro aminopeptidase [Balneola sp.]|jgi:Xaa-Pro aminopeptidase|nr:Xaa-Pro aminopeptidase [Balneola sp.]MAO77101.1 Xaa-Pro aminopeptidase [Balneola sp.]MBF64668.1 Xaa-Pro aminopeptidase [Balneola sp.]MBF65920.1 Xaa-Pro aminopeptidase [Balneola sp.]HAH51487.1 Xaa-Pro aminopeptidase [Balneola sp.]|tara:strand:+ start:11638 stop:12990 length:1353 start_codon:yes stop_codon:yes gene_type:complete
MKKLGFLFLILLFLIPDLSAQNGYPEILSMKERAEVIDDLLEDKIQTVLPDLMRRTGIDMWVVVSREYNEDPVIKTLLPATWLAARRRTILVMYDQGEGKGVETLAVARYDVGKTFKKAWDKEKEPDQWNRLKQIIEERNPKTIGVNQSDDWGLADGIVATDLQEMKSAIGKKYSDRIVSAEKLAVGWLETRSAKEMTIYPQIVRIAHKIIAQGFSDEVIQPGVTTTEDVVWWFREKIRELKLITWFHPSVSIQRADPESFDHLRSFSSRPDNNVIMPGDLLHVDFGINYLRLNTDTQQHAYILRPGETEVPEYLNKAFDNGNRLQDIFTNNFKEGRTGNEVLKMSREQAIAEGLKPSIYTHPIGYHGHAAGTTLGMWDSQGGVPGSGDYPLHLNTAYSIELNAATMIEEWGKEIRIMLEEDAFFDETGVWYIDGRQKEIMMIPRVPAKQ